MLLKQFLTWKWKILWPLTALALLFFSSSLLIFAEDPDPKPVYPAGEEIKEVRTRHSKIFKDEHDKETIYLSMLPLH